jgi:putative ABC transport system permease protein
MASIARKNLFEDIPRFLVAQAGIMFAVSLVTIQTGIFNGFTRTSTNLIDGSTADIWVASTAMAHLDLTLPLPVSQIVQAQQVEGVERAEALIIKGPIWRSVDGKIEPVRMIGLDPQGELFKVVNITQGSVKALSEPYTVMMDVTDLKTLNVQKVGDGGELNSLPAKVVGFTKGNHSITSNAFMFTSLENANTYINSGISSNLYCKSQKGSEGLTCTTTYVKTKPAEAVQTSPNATPDSAPTPKPLAGTDLISYILIQAKSDQNLQQLKQRLETALPNTRAYTQAEIIDWNQKYWQERTGVGFVLGLGAVVGIIVGVVIVSQILYSSVSTHLKEFGTLKAMGASDWVIYGVIVEQALWMAVLGYLPSMALCLGLGTWTAATQGILILITPMTAIAVLGLTVVMCVGSSIFAIQRVTRVDPAIVFKA